jgi:large subunit ribosomal protein L2
MGLKKFRPITPSLRYTELDDFSDITTDKPYRPLTIARRKTGGRNNNGRITCRHRGGGHKQRIRIIDFKRDKNDIPAEVITIEYDPIRTARIALLKYKDGERRYIIAPNGLAVGQIIMSGSNCEPVIGNAMPLEKIPLGTTIHNIEIIPGRGAQICRSAGGAATLMALDAGYANIRMPSGEIRKIHAKCYATIGQVSNLDNFNKSLGKAGRKRWMGVRPTVRGMVMNPIDHPNGGGQGKSKGGGGRQHLVSPWGQIAKGLKTRRKHKNTNKFIIQDRRKK